jgi:hypothetical protein
LIEISGLTAKGEQGEHPDQIIVTLSPPGYGKDCRMATHTQEVGSGPLSPTRLNASASAIRFGIPEAAEILRMSRAQLYNRISDGAIKPHKDGGRTYITRCELERYVDSFR